MLGGYKGRDEASSGAYPASSFRQEDKRNKTVKPAAEPRASEVTAASTLICVRGLASREIRHSPALCQGSRQRGCTFRPSSRGRGGGRVRITATQRCSLTVRSLHLNLIMSSEHRADGYAPLNPDLEFMLGQVAETLQLTPTQRRLAEERYGGIAIGSREVTAPWVRFGRVCTRRAPCRSERRSGLQVRRVRPRRCLRDGRYGKPPALYEEVYQRLHANPAYRGILTRKNRCLCLGYANDFHLDLILRCPTRSGWHERQRS